MALRAPRAAAAPAGLSVVLTGSSGTSWDGGAGGWFSDLLATPTNATGPVIYAWSFVSGQGTSNLNFDNTGPDPTNFVSNDGTPRPGATSIKVTATDNNGPIDSNTLVLT